MDEISKKRVSLLIGHPTFLQLQALWLKFSTCRNDKEERDFCYLLRKVALRLNLRLNVHS